MSNTYGDGGQDAAYPDMRPNDRKGFTYTSPPLERDRTAAGHPVVRLRVESTGADGDFFVYLEEVEEDGSSRYLSEGALRASNRATVPRPTTRPGSRTTGPTGGTPSRCPGASPSCWRSPCSRWPTSSTPATGSG